MLTRLTVLFLCTFDEHNYFTVDFGPLYTLTFLFLLEKKKTAANDLTGSIPSELGMLVELTYLWIGKFGE